MFRVNRTSDFISRRCKTPLNLQNTVCARSFRVQFAGNDPQVTDSLQKMKPNRTDSQLSLFNFPLEKILNADHPLVILSSKIDWSQFDDLVAPCYSEEGRPGCTTRLMIGQLEKTQTLPRRLG